jgi:hypothetical protein
MKANTRRTRTRTRSSSSFSLSLSLSLCTSPHNRKYNKAFSDVELLFGTSFNNNNNRRSLHRDMQQKDEKLTCFGMIHLGGIFFFNFFFFDVKIVAVLNKQLASKIGGFC